jgi:hypothetical protein
MHIGKKEINIPIYIMDVILFVEYLRLPSNRLSFEYSGRGTERDSSKPSAKNPSNFRMVSVNWSA